MSAWIILDRDGVINYDSPHFIKSSAEWIPLPGSIEAIARLSQAGWRIAVATNQSGLARGLFDRAALQTMHDKMQALVNAAGGHIDAVFFCPHAPQDNCDCRKPKPGLLTQISAYWQTSLHGVTVVGDRLSDLQAAQAVGAQPLLVLTGKGTQTQAELATTEFAQVPVYADLAAVTHALLG
jgi:D-glycero-D-manno-heptose 1,7-bisphosphate phosphatase